MDNNVPENFFGNRWISKQFIFIRRILIRCILIRCILICCILIHCMFTGSSVFRIYSNFWTFLKLYILVSDALRIYSESFFLNTAVMRSWSE